MRQKGEGGRVKEVGVPEEGPHGEAGPPAPPQPCVAPGAARLLLGQGSGDAV